jgi:tetratricopeptide (TPR) repeat protein
MPLNWLNGREAAAVGAALAENVLLQAGSQTRGSRNAAASQRQKLQQFLEKFLLTVDREARSLKLNVYKRAKLANSFKWRLLENGMEREVVDELCRALVLRLTTGGGAAPIIDAAAEPPRRERRARGDEIAALLANGDACLARGDYTQAVQAYDELLGHDARHAVAHNNLGMALIKLGRYVDAEAHFRRALSARSKYVDAHVNLAAVLQWTGRIAESEAPLRQALRAQPTRVDAQINLGVVLELRGRLNAASEVYEKLSRVAAGNPLVLLGLGRIASLEGRLAEAETYFTRARDADPRSPGPWAALAGLRKMTSSDGAWLKGALQVSEMELIPVEETQIRFALGKYYDDVGDFAQAFRQYQRGNELQKTLSPRYDPEARERWVDECINVYTRERLSGPHPGSSESARPVFVVGMMRSGTSLVEQIIASHPAAHGAGELDFWQLAAAQHEAVVRHGLPEEPLRKKLAETYLQTLKGHSAEASRVVDKATINCDYLGLIHSVFPRARMIYLQRDPLDTCLSCYFQRFSFSATYNFAWDLSELAHYYRQHRRLMDHWRRALPGTVLDVPYEELVADQEGWTRKILDFIGLEWDERCLNFHQTRRTVFTASYAQVRQQMYTSSAGRWRNYRKFIGPLLSLRD